MRASCAQELREGAKQGRTGGVLLTGGATWHPEQQHLGSTVGAVHPQPRRALKISTGQARDDSYLAEATCPVSQVCRRLAQPSRRPSNTCGLTLSRRALRLQCSWHPHRCVTCARPTGTRRTRVHSLRALLCGADKRGLAGRLCAQRRRRQRRACHDDSGPAGARGQGPPLSSQGRHQLVRALAAMLHERHMVEQTQHGLERLAAWRGCCMMQAAAGQAGSAGRLVRRRAVSARWPRATWARWRARWTA